eukprot:6200126-Pleurochrysis_carterae.AAC.1
MGKRGVGRASARGRGGGSDEASDEERIARAHEDRVKVTNHVRAKGKKRSKREELWASTEEKIAAAAARTFACGTGLKKCFQCDLSRFLSPKTH